MSGTADADSEARTNLDPDRSSAMGAGVRGTPKRERPRIPPRWIELAHHPMGLAIALLVGVSLPYASTSVLPLALWPLWLTTLALLIHRRFRPIGLLVLGLVLSEHQIRTAMERRPSATMTVPLSGTIADLPESFERAQRFVLLLDRHDAAASPHRMRRVRLSWYQPNQALSAGMHVVLEAKVRRPRADLNPGGFDFERYALAQRIDAVGYVTRLVESKPAERAHVLRARAYLSHQWQQALGDTPASQLLRALVVGDTQALDDAAWDQFRRTGTTHLIAISGLHITGLAWLSALLAGHLLGWFPGLFRVLPKPVWQALAGLLAAGGYCLIAGFGIPAQRTLVALAVFLGAIVLRRGTTAWQALGWAAIAVLLFDPLSVLHSGFWLSFGAVFAILWINAGRRLHAPPWREFLDVQWRLSLLLIPLGLWWFQQLSLAGPLTNLWAVPWISFFTVPLALLASALHGLPGLGPALQQLAGVAAEMFLAGTEWAANLPWAELRTATPNLPVLLTVSIGLLWLTAPRGWPQRWAGAPLLLLFALPGEPRPAKGDFRLHVFDVGQGLSILVRTHSTDLLYDTGPGRDDAPVAAERTVLPALRQLGVSTLERIIISHADSDHAGGLDVVRESFPAPVDTSAPLPHARACTMGMRFTLDDVQFAYLHPNPGLPYLRNDSSCVLRIQGSSGIALFPGDISAAIEERLVARQADRLRANVLIAPHHGSASSSSEPFVAAVKPELVVHASGFQDRFDFPKPAVVERYRRIGATQLETGTSGAIDIRFGAHGPMWQAWRTLQPARWRE